MQNFTVQPITKQNLRYVRQDDGADGKCIDAYALLKAATNVTQPTQQKDLLTDLYRRCPSIEAGESHHFFGRIERSLSLSVHSAYHLLISLGGPVETVRHSCIAVGRHLDLNETESSALFEEITGNSSETAGTRNDLSC